MFQVFASGSRHATQPRRRGPIAAVVKSVALAAPLAGNAAAFQLAGDGPGTNVRLVTPRQEPRLAAGQYLEFKLATTAGRNVLIFG